MAASNKIQVGYIEAQDGAQFQIDAGTAAAPGLVFDDSAATGLYSPGTGQIAWSTSGKQTALRILADGKVGVDCSPTVAFEVNGTIKASAIDAPIEGTLDDWIVHAGDTNTKFGFSANDTFQVHTSGTPSLQLDSTGRVLIGNAGTYSASGDLHVVGDTNSNGPELYLQVNNNNTTDNIGAIWFGNNVDKSIVKLAGHTHTANNTGDFTVSTSSGGTSGERLRITSGDVASFGNDSPPAWQTGGGYYNIQLANAGYFRADTDASNNFLSYGVNAYRDSSGWKFIENGRATQVSHQAGEIFFNVSNSGNADGAITFDQALRITSDGDVSIGGRDNAMANYAAGTATTKLAVATDDAGSGYHEMAHFTAGSDANDTGAIVRITQFSNDRGIYIKGGRGTSDQAKGIIGLRNASAADQDAMTLLQGGRVLIGTDVAPSNSNTKFGVHLPISSSSANAIEISHNTNGANKPGAAFGLAIGNSGASTNAADLYISTATNGSLEQRLTIRSGGTVHTKMTGTPPTWLGETFACREKFSVFQGANFGEACFNLDVDNGQSFLSHNLYYNSGWKTKKTSNASLQLEMGGAGFRFRKGSDGGNDGASTLDTQFVIDENGNFGFNQDNPTNAESGNDTVLAIRGKGSSYSGRIQFRDSSDNEDARIACDNGFLDIHADPADATSNSMIRFFRDNEERLRICEPDVYHATLLIKPAEVNGCTLIADNYTSPGTSSESCTAIGLNYSGSGLTLGYGAKPARSANGFLSTQDAYADRKAAIAIGGSGYAAFGVWTHNASSTVSVNSAVSMNKVFEITHAGTCQPGSDNNYDLGSSANRWRNVFTTDLQLSNVGGGGNDVDGTEGEWTLQEGANDIYMINRASGKKYKMVLQEVS